MTDLVEELTAQRAAARVGEQVRVLVESSGDTGPEGRADHQGPEVDGVTTLAGLEGSPDLSTGDRVTARVVTSHGADLVAVPLAAADSGGGHG